ncbi:hypothetical protein IC232_09545 [Microvirga sp. BT688]|nr:hypothetical protein [Microvirga sp.]
MHQLGLKIFYALTLLFSSHLSASSYDSTGSAKVVPMLRMTQPGYLEPFNDPAFGTSVTRITDPGQPMLPEVKCDPVSCRHRYSSAQAWNADQTLMVIPKGCNGMCFLDGQTYKPAFYRPVHNECEWHPYDAALMICMDGKEIYGWKPRDDLRTTIYKPHDYKGLQFGPSKGNMSLDGHKLVVRAVNKVGLMVAFAYDIFERRKYPDIPVGGLPGVNDYCSISPSAQYVLCDQRLVNQDRSPDAWPPEIDQAFIFTIEGTQVQHWIEHHRPGHGDMTLDPDGSDVFIGVSKAEPDKFHLIKRRLKDGLVTELAPYGQHEHSSVRNIRRPGWVFVTYVGTEDRARAEQGVVPFYQEIIAVRTDGSGEIRRIAHTRGAAHNYTSEPHATPSSDGSQVVWASNWGLPGGPVSSYVAKILWPGQ